MENEEAEITTATISVNSLSNLLLSIFLHDVVSGELQSKQEQTDFRRGF